MDELHRLGEIRAELEGEGGGGEGFISLAEPRVDGGAGARDRGVVRIGGFALEQCCDSFLLLAHAVAGEAEVIPGAGVTGIKFDGFLQLSEGQEVAVRGGEARDGALVNVEKTTMRCDFLPD